MTLTGVRTDKSNDKKIIHMTLIYQGREIGRWKKKFEEEFSHKMKLCFFKILAVGEEREREF